MKHVGSIVGTVPVAGGFAVVKDGYSGGQSVRWFVMKGGAWSEPVIRNDRVHGRSPDGALVLEEAAAYAVARERSNV